MSWGGQRHILPRAAVALGATSEDPEAPLALGLRNQAVAGGADQQRSLHGPGTGEKANLQDQLQEARALRRALSFPVGAGASRLQPLRLL